MFAAESVSGLAPSLNTDVTVPSWEAPAPPIVPLTEIAAPAAPRNSTLEPPATLPVIASDPAAPLTSAVIRLLDPSVIGPVHELVPPTLRRAPLAPATPTPFSVSGSGAYEMPDPLNSLSTPLPETTVPAAVEPSAAACWASPAALALIVLGPV